MPGGYGRGNRYRWIYRSTGVPGLGRGRSPAFGPRYPDMMYPYPEPGMDPYMYQEPGMGPYMYPPRREIDPKEEIRMMEQELDMMEQEQKAISEDIEALRNEIQKRKEGDD